MSKKTLLISALVLGLVLILVISILMTRRNENPEILLKRLKKGKGDREEILMRLNMARGDVAGPMIRSFNDKAAPASFRAEVLDLLFKKNLRTPDPDIESTLVAGLRDADIVVRRKAAYDFQVFTDARLQPLLIPHLNDPDSVVRRSVYAVFSENNELWAGMSDSVQTAVFNAARKQRAFEHDSIMAYLNRSVIGQGIAKICQQGVNAMQKTELELADSLFKCAMALDSTGYRTQLILARYYAEQGDKEKALKVARSASVLAEIPRLPSAPKLDGDPTDPVWDKAMARDQFVMGNRFAFRKGTGKGLLRIGTFGGKVYLSVMAYETDVDKLKVTPGARDAKSVWADDCLEMVFSPKLDRRRYYKFIVNAGGTLYDRFSSNPSANFNCEHAAKVFKDRGYWGLEFAVAAKDLDNNSFKPGDLWNISVVWNRAGALNERDYFWYDYDDDLYILALFK